MRDQMSDQHGVTTYTQWPDTADGTIEEGVRVWVVDTEAVPGVYDDETGEEITPPVPEEGHWGFDVTVRAMTEAEVAEWHARQPPPPPLVPDEERLTEDRLNAFVALLYEDSVKMQYIMGNVAQGRPLDVGLLMEADAFAVSKLASRADDRAALDEMTIARLARAEAARREP